MWYVMQVPTGQEQALQKKCAQMIDWPVLEKSFLPYYDEMRKQNGEWVILRRVLFPGYVFMVTDRPKELHQALREIGGWKKLLTTGSEIVPLTPLEEAFLRELGNEDQIVRASRGVIEDDQIIITEGPLMGKEAYIRKIDRHKRRAYLDLHLFSEIIHVQVALEIYAKNTQVRLPDAEMLLAKEEKPAAVQTEERPQERYNVTLLTSDQAVVTLDEDQSAEQIQKLYQQSQQDEKGE